MDNSMLNEKHQSNLLGYEIAMDGIEKILNDPDLYDGVICMDNDHRLMFDTDKLSYRIMNYMHADYRDYFMVLENKEAEDEN